MDKVKRANRTIINIVRTMLINTKLPQALWPELAKIAVYLRNRSPTKTLPQTPYEALWKRKPNLSYLRIISSMIYAYNTQLTVKVERRRKLDPRAKKGYLVGYGEGTHQYRMWNPATNNVKEVILCRIDETDTQISRGKLNFADFNPDKPFTRDPDYELSESESEHEEYSSEHFSTSEHHEAPNQKRIKVVIPKKRIAKRLYKKLPNLTN
jgi:cellulose synthase/poly-beta-1,6-N-acetylglucosamine synthase-like glycosyltransferase